MLGLTHRRDAQIEGGAQRHGHNDCLLRSSARPEQLIKQIAEPRFEHVEFGVRNRHTLGPIVGDGPGLNIMFDRSAKARPRAGDDEKIVGKHTAFGAAAAQ